MDMDMDFGELMAKAIFEVEKEASEHEAKKVMSFIKLNCLKDGYIVETPSSKKTRVCTIAKYIVEHIDEID